MNYGIYQTPKYAPCHTKQRDILLKINPGVATTHYKHARYSNKL